MLLDHIGAFLYPLEFLRIIGRIAFPCFAYQLGIGYRMTSSKKAYLKKLFIFALVSQIPYSLLRGGFMLNILFALMLGILAVWSLENKKFFYLFLIVHVCFFADFGIYGLSVILIFYFFKNKVFQFFLLLSATLLYSAYYNLFIQAYAMLSLVFIFNPFLKINLPKNFFYIFYPAHLIIIYLIKVFLIQG